MTNLEKVNNQKWQSTLLYYKPKQLQHHFPDKFIVTTSGLFSFAKVIELVLLLRSNYSAREYCCEAKLTILLVLHSRISVRSPLGSDNNSRAELF